MKFNEAPIEAIPSLPEGLKNAAKAGSLVPFIGAGVSAIAGCPLWDEFADASLKVFLKSGELNYSQYNQLTSSLSARQKLSIAIGLESSSTKIKFEEILETKDLDENIKKKGNKIYSLLSDFSKVFITTNYDNWLERPIVESLSALSDESSPSEKPKLIRNCLNHPDNFSLNDLHNEGTVIQVHGSVKDRKTMILTTADYLKRYSNHRLQGRNTNVNRYLTFLENLFLRKNVIFIGYGLGDLEILEYVMQKGLKSMHEQTAISAFEQAPRHYIVMPFYTHELVIMENLKNYYYKEFKVELIPFSIDEKGYDQLIDVVEYLSKEIPIGKLLASQNALEMRGLLNDG